MNFIEFTKARLFSCFFITATLLFLQGCGPLVTLYADLKINDRGNATGAPPDLSTDRLMVQMAKEFALMSLFSEVIYRRDLLEQKYQGSGCDYLLTAQKNDPNTLFGMPHGSDPEKNRWQRWIPASVDPKVHPCFDDSGLYYETYIHLNGEGKFDEAVIAYRGTENYLNTFFDDWSTNFAGSLGFEPKEYKIAAENLPALVEALINVFNSQGVNGKIYAVGHSLGGGLAQQAGYLQREISEVYAFNTTPVSNWSHLRLQQKIKNAWPIIHRVSHGGEFLEKARFAATSATPARFGRHDIGLQLEGRTNFGGHSMKIITCNFAEILAKQKDAVEAAHYYPLSYIIKGVLNQDSDYPSVMVPCKKEPPES